MCNRTCSICSDDDRNAKVRLARAAEQDEAENEKRNNIMQCKQTKEDPCVYIYLSYLCVCVCVEREDNDGSIVE